MVVRSDNVARRALTPLPADGDVSGHSPAGAVEIFTRGFLNASLLQLAICAPPRQAAMRRQEQVHITELGERARRRIQPAEAEAALR
jgi:hypothetical protein